MRIDAHQHFWNPARGDYFWMVGEATAPIAKPILPKDMAGHLAQHDIEKTVLVQAAPTVVETEYMLGIADATDHVAKVVGWVDFENRDDLKHLSRLAKHPKFSGVRPMIQDLPDAEWMHRKDVQWAFDALIDLDLTFDALGFPLHLDPFSKLFAKYPKLRTVIDHCMKPVIRDGQFDDWAAKMAAIAKETNVFCKLSGIATEAKPGWTLETLRPYGAHVLEGFGADRVMWGSDWPVLNLNGSYDSWFSAAQSIVPQADHAKVFGGTAAKFYRIK
ncbi:amidohydrolase family protein [Aestuariivirga litoralis]|uniref:amidohydrolase family protein n=1 Tax=Aestuariivirga litoralis TaxID=2650924 RepID=UPI0018C818EE|nr:amidohydrolase family protein [Aestuariivirga litoralis]MBG1233786.1 amidohydrolase family protein [Aestuariivirga litoralis]